MAEKDREFVPVGVRSDVTKNTEQAGAQPKTTEQPSAIAKGTINVTSNPAGADVDVDGAFVGNSPATLKLEPGKHTITVKMSGYKDWSRDISVESSSEVQLTASLEK